MAILAIDCATDACSAALSIEGAAGPHRWQPMQRGHAEAIMPMVRGVMGEAGLGFADLAAIAVTTGPGAFTGIRIGLAAARGFALAARLPIIGVTTLEAVAAMQERGDEPVLVALDSKRDDIYIQLFSPEVVPLTRPKAAMPPAIREMLPRDQPVAVAGSAADRVCEAIASHKPAIRRLAGPELPDASAVAEIATRRILETPGGIGDTRPAALYLRPPDAVPAAVRRPA